MRKRNKALIYFGLYFLTLLFLIHFFYDIYSGHGQFSSKELILSLNQYGDEEITGIWEKLYHRITVQPFNLVAAILFVFAIIHTFLAHNFTVISQRWRKQNMKLGIEPVDSFGVGVMHFMGEIEVVFGMWAIPLFALISYNYSWLTAISYFDHIEFVEPMFVVIIMIIASSGPIIKLAEDVLRIVANLGGGTAKAWWWAILTIGPLTGSIITEAGAMTISALLLARKFYHYGPRRRFAYGTLGLLFTNISVGGVLTSFAAPPVLMVSKSWGWDTPFMLTNFGWKAVLGILIANLVYYFLFKSDFVELEKKRDREKKKEIMDKREKTIPFWVTLIHVYFLAWIVVHNQHPVIFIGSFLFFLGFYQATLPYQKELSLKPPILVGFFLAGLVIHGNLQGWWIEPILTKATEGALLVISAFITSFNDNAELTFLASLIPSFDDAMKYAVVAGAVTGGGLTVIANAPNPSGQAILGKYFFGGISAISLLIAAIFPAIIMGLTFYLLR